MKLRLYILLAGLLVPSFAGIAQENNTGYRIDVKVVGIKDTTITLAHRYGDKFYSDQTIKVDNKGAGTFTGSETLPEGMYQLVLPDKTFLDFFIDSDQLFQIETKVPDYVQNNKATGHKYNQLFFNWHRASVKYRNSPQMNTVWDTTLVSLGESLTGKFLQGIKPFQVPESLKANSDFSSNQMAQYTYYKEHFFDDIDLSDSRLLRTPLIFNKLNQFFSKVAPPQPDSISWYCDQILSETKTNHEMFQFTLQFILNYYSEPKIMGTDAVYVHLAKNYYLSGQADWIDETNLRIIGDRVAEIEHLLIGKPGPRLKNLQTPKGEIIDPFESDAEFIILYFWEPDCGHCKKTTPELFASYNNLKALGAEVYAINTRDNFDNWKSFIDEHELSWVNLYSPMNVRAILEAYNAWSTPLIFILDKGKRIVAKDLDVSQVEEYLNFLSQSKK